TRFSRDWSSDVCSSDLTVEKLMPAGKYIAGKMTSNLTVKGKLDQEMSPVLNSLTGAGDLLLIDGVLSKFEPVERLAEKLNIKQQIGRASRRERAGRAQV